MTLRQTMGVKGRLILSVAYLLLVFGAGLASAQCEPGSFCDGDGDGFFRDHRRCRDCPGPRDCDDSDPTAGPCEGTVEYTAELTAGAFVFRDGTGQPVALNVFPAEGGDRLLSAETLRMLRPQDPDLQAVWDEAFQTLCPGLGVVPDGILASPDNWSISGYGGVRLGLRDFLVEDDGGNLWEVWIQLIGIDDPEAPLLPPVGGEPSVFSLPTVSMWGKPVTKKGRSSDCIGGPLPQAPLSLPSVLTITAKEP